MTGRMVALGSSLFVLVLALGFSVLGADQPVEQPEWRRLIVSPDWQDVRRAAATVLGEQKATVSALLEVLDLPVAQGESFFGGENRRNTAIRLLGDLRAPEAVPALAKWLMPRPGQDAGSSLRLTDLSPAGDALVKIGTPALLPVVDILASVGVSSEWKRTSVKEPDGSVRFVGPPLERYSPLGDQCLKIVVYIKGLEETEAGLRRYIATETGEARKKNLQDALAALSRPSIRQGFLHVQEQNEVREWSDWRGWWKKEEEKRAKEKAGQPESEAKPQAGR